MVSAQSKVWLLCLLTATGSLRAEQTNGSNPEKNQTSSEAKTSDNKEMFLVPQKACDFLARKHRSHDLVGELLPYLLDLDDFGYWPKRCKEEMLSNPSARPAYCPAETETST
ncbi:uncharacterized protein [Littorina saxatilis]|uniref:Uncharacterized protein n=1 Tax=Littorina saxatilis TaxID=31220 RepID=A0AAN9AJ78_9CAEN